MLTLSGCAGVGKSILVNKLSNATGDYVYSESARILIPLEKKLLKISKDPISLKCMIVDMQCLSFALDNEIENIIWDRNLLDAIVYIKIYYPEIKIDTEFFKDYLLKICEKYNRTHIYRSSVLLTHSNDIDYLKTIVSDPIRSKTSSIKSYLDNAKKWEDCYLELSEEFEMVSETLMVLKSYPEEKNGLDKIIQIHYED
jgi:predicted ATPase